MDSKDCCNDFHKWGVPSIDSMLSNDQKLKDFEKDIRRRYAIYEKTRIAIESSEGIDRFSQGHKEFGLNITPEGGVMCREWIPFAKAVYISGDFNNWEKWSFERKAFGKWEMYIGPNFDGSCRIHHLSELKLFIETEDKQSLERISPWARYVVQSERASTFKWLFWNPPRSEVCIPTNRRPPKPRRLRVYEAHIGISSDRCEVASYRHFANNVLPRIKDLGYNCVLLMAVMEHPFYPSLGYEISNFFAASSRYGTPDELREMINVAHGMGITVMMDVVHSQAAKNTKDGLNMFDGSDDCYFHEGKRGYHESNDARIFNLTKWEVLRFLLSNLRCFMDEYNVDGFRFCGVTSMIYHDHGANRGYSDDYRQYFGMHMDLESIPYMMLANEMLHSFYPSCLTIAEDDTEMPTLCRPVREGGIGFDYRLGKQVPNKWMKLLDENRDEDWNMGFIFHAMTQRRNNEKVIVCAESREQSMVGKQTIISKLIGDELCENMSDLKPLTPRVERGMCLHKMIRLMTHALAGDSYMNFIGNEFGHPDFLEFPSPSNNDSYNYARRRFELCNSEELKYKYLRRFDQAMNQAEERYGWLDSVPGYVSRKHEGDKVFVFERADLLFLFNFHPTQSYPDYKVGIDQSGTYKIILDTDDKYFGGHGRNQSLVEFHTQSEMFDNRNNSVMVYLPSRCAIVMASNHHSNNGAYPKYHGNHSSGNGSYGYNAYDTTPIHW